MNQVQDGVASSSHTFNLQKFINRQSSSFATLLRSHSASLTFRKSSAFKKPDITKESFFAGYADMATTTTEHERPSRKLKSENKLYSFLTRSRSRSRSNAAAEPTTTTPKPRHPPDNSGSKPPSRLQSRPLSSTTTSTATVTPGTPKASRKSQRPATANSPVTTPRAQLQRRPSSPVRHPSSNNSRPSSARRRLQDFFTGRKSSTSRSRSRSRPSSPTNHLQLNDNLPPLPNNDTATRINHRKSSSSPARITTPSPPPGPKVLRVTNATTTSSSTGSTAASIKISKFFSKDPSPSPKLPTPGPPTLPPLPISRVSSLYRRSTANKDKDKDKELPSSLAIPTPPSPSSPTLPQPPRIMHTPPTPLKSPRESSTNINLNASGSGSSSQSHSQSSHLPVPSRPIYHAAKSSLDSSTSYRYRGNTSMGIVSEESPFVSPGPYKGKAREGVDPPSSSTNLHLLHSRPSMKMSSAARATKHGSFDFERPGWGSVAAVGSPGSNAEAVRMQRSGSSGTTGTGTSDRTSEILREKERDAREREKERESTYGPGLAGVGTLQREMSMKRAQEREEMMRRKRREEKEREKEREKEEIRKREEERDRPPTSSQRTTPSASDHMHASTSTGGTGTTAKHSSSAGKAAGKRMQNALGGATKPNLGAVSRLRVPHHGLFSFEPPVPSPTRPTITTNTGKVSEVAVGVKPDREKTPRTSAIPIGRRSNDRPPVPVPSVAALYGISSTPPEIIAGSSETTTSKLPSSFNSKIPAPAPGHRSGKKGRSLDLGLGLAWAPSKVREEALMNLPKSGFFSTTAGGIGQRRTSSGGSSVPGIGAYTGRNGMLRTASESTTHSGTGTSKNGTMEDVERSKLGKEVAQLFKNALDPEAYRLFKLYVHQFDREEIPFDGPKGIVSLVQDLLVASPLVTEDAKRRLFDKFVKIILQQT
ncbi:hypothetical protein D9613_005121 [Agrocybe pediades]|uniref:Uncharacterized protein n=1 Tax=Agrocybe pediades TaxID=84607 RepID=A0A8H4QZA2_9AGAR|nr:hypothetical protein D9613_005121 [Agrocybe pediades]